MKNSKITSTSLNLVRYYELQRDMKNYQKRIKNVRPTLRQTRELTNRSCGHIKKQPLAQFNRIVAIDMDNHALLKKLTQKTPSFLGKSKPFKLIKNNRKKNIEEYKQRIQNTGLLKRIRQVKSSYQTCKFESQRKITEGYINTISKFGYKNLTPNKTIMLPFFMQNQIKTKTNFNTLEKFPQKTSQKQPIQKNQLNCTTKQLDTILKIEKKAWCSKNTTANITYIVWQNKVSIQVDFIQQNIESMKIQIPKQVFTQYFGQKIKKLHNSIKYNESQHIFYLDLSDHNKQNSNPINRNQIRQT